MPPSLPTRLSSYLRTLSRRRWLHALPPPAPRDRAARSAQILQHQLRRRLGRSDHARNARARMRPRPHEIEVLDAIIAVVDAKPCGLPKQRPKAEGGAEVRVQLALDVGGREIMAGQQDRKSTSLNASH